MVRRILVAAVLAIAVFAAGRSIAREVRNRVIRPSGTATVAGPRSTPTPRPTPLPPLPPNPGGLARWDVEPVHFCISGGGTGYVTPVQFIDAVARAFNAWGIPWRSDGPCGSVTQGDGVNEIGWGSLPSSGGAEYEAGLTQTITEECTANCNPDDRIRLTEADITIDRSPPREFRNDRCFYSTLLHEVGHFLGLVHLPLPAVMAAKTTGCPTELTAADRQALRDRYGARAP